MIHCSWALQYRIARNVGVAKIWRIALKNGLAIKNLAS